MVLFNQYNDVEGTLDRTDAAGIRIRNLRNYLASIDSVPRILMVGEAPGPKGCRFSGVPFTSESQLCRREIHFWGQQSSKGLSPYSEISATVFWRALKPFHQRFLVWNCVPFHPHKPGIPLSVRNPDDSEVARYVDILGGFYDILRPDTVIAIGKRALHALSTLGTESAYVRHPSMGGASEFREAVSEIFGKSY